jgi:hypothetical protein
MTDGESKSLISTAILCPYFSAGNFFYAPKSAFKSVCSNTQTKGASVIVHPSFSRVRRREKCKLSRLDIRSSRIQVRKDK